MSFWNYGTPVFTGGRYDNLHGDEDEIYANTEEEDNEEEVYEDE